ncbi:hypothetical protein K7432_016380 [Basidiobolus ranarum]
MLASSVFNLKTKTESSSRPFRSEDSVTPMNRGDSVDINSFTNAESEPQDISAPLVFQCNACRSIVGDSYSWVCATKELNSVSLYGKSDQVQLGEELLTSNSGFDIGSTYIPLTCSCDVILGKVYKTTPRLLDNVR